MPFPIGILRVESQPKGALTWALNGFFTVVGGLLSVILSLFLGLFLTLLSGLIIYLVGFFAFLLHTRQSLEEGKAAYTIVTA